MNNILYPPIRQQESEVQHLEDALNISNTDKAVARLRRAVQYVEVAWLLCRSAQELAPQAFPVPVFYGGAHQAMKPLLTPASASIRAALKRLTGVAE